MASDFGVDLSAARKVIVPPEVQDIFTENQIHDYCEAFFLKDPTNTGKIALKTVSELLTKINHEFHEDDLQTRAKKLDIDVDVSLKEFLILAAKTFQPIPTEEQVLKAFHVFEPKRNNISMGDLFYYMTQCGEPLDEDEMKVLTQLAVEDHKGETNFETLVNILSAREDTDKDLKKSIRRELSGYMADRVKGQGAETYQRSKSLEDLLESIDTVEKFGDRALQSYLSSEGVESEEGGESGSDADTELG